MAGRNRIHLIVDDLDAEIDRLRGTGLPFRSDVVAGPGGRQILLADPAGNLVELSSPPGGRPGADGGATAGPPGVTRERSPALLQAVGNRTDAGVGCCRSTGAPRPPRPSPPCS